MKTIGLVMLVSGLALATGFLIVGACCAAPWSTGSAVLFGLGVAYTGLCSISSAASQQEASQ